MRVCDFVSCATLPYLDMDTAGYRIPALDLDPSKISIVMISESAAPDARDDYYAAGAGRWHRSATYWPPTRARRDQDPAPGSLVGVGAFGRAPANAC
jgi:hypothetical protein